MSSPAHHPSEWTRTALDIMHAQPPEVKETASADELLVALASSKVGAVLIIDEQGLLTGIYTEHDLAKHLTRRLSPDLTARDLMRPRPRVVAADATIAEVAKVMEEMKCRHVPVVDQNRPIGMVTILDTQAHLIEGLRASLERLQASQESLALRDEYIAIVAHDVRSPLSVIQSCCQYLNASRQQGQEFDAAATTMLIETMEKSARDGLRLVNELLDLGRLNSGAKLQCRVSSLTKLCETVTAALSQLAEQKGQRLVSILAPHIEANIDPDRIAQALTNLVNNALKFTPPGRQVTVRLALKGEKAHISVEDEGPGVPSDKLHRLFKRYDQLDQGMATATGFGLGLSIAQQFVALHHGQIQVDGGGEGRGATFSIELPNAHSALNLPLPKVGGVRILLIDDDQLSRQDLESTLSAAGYDVHTSRSVSDGLAAFTRLKPDLVVTELQSPHINGVDLSRRLHRLNPKTPLMFLSTFVPSRAQKDALRIRDTWHFLQKPLNPKSVLENIAHCLSAAKEAA